MTAPDPTSLLAVDSTPKGIRADAQRAVSPEKTLERVRPLFGAIGLTRLADITGLDVIGIPVVLSVRPQSGYLSVDGGKGFTTAAATASAAMECFERHAGEYTPFERFSCAYADLPSESRIPESDLPLARNSLYGPDLLVPWTWAQDLLGGPDTAVPTVLVGLERHKHQRSSALPFHFSSNGLNSGNTKSEALIGALYEVIERDATTCTKVSWEQGAPMRRVDLGTATSPDIAYLVEKIRGAGLEVVVIDCTVDTKVPTFSAYLCDLRNPAMGVYHGYGTHLDPEVAVIRAIAKQPRVAWCSSPAAATTPSGTIAGCIRCSPTRTASFWACRRSWTYATTQTNPAAPSRRTGARWSPNWPRWDSPESSPSISPTPRSG